METRKHQVMAKTVLSSLELTILIINFSSTNLKIALKTLQIKNFKKHLMTKKCSLHRTTKEIQQNVKPKHPKIIIPLLFLYNNCIYHNAGYTIPYSSFSFKLTNGKTVLRTKTVSYQNFCCYF